MRRTLLDGRLQLMSGREAHSYGMRRCTGRRSRCRSSSRSRRRGRADADRGGRAERPAATSPADGAKQSRRTPIGAARALLPGCATNFPRSRRSRGITIRAAAIRARRGRRPRESSAAGGSRARRDDVPPQRLDSGQNRTPSVVLPHGHAVSSRAMPRHRRRKTTPAPSPCGRSVYSRIDGGGSASLGMRPGTQSGHTPPILELGDRLGRKHARAVVPAPVEHAPERRSHASRVVVPARARALCGSSHYRC